MATLNYKVRKELMDLIDEELRMVNERAQAMAQLHHVVKRELLLCGTFEDARLLYTKFHNKITSAIGDHLPGLMAEVKSIPALQRPFEADEE